MHVEYQRLVTKRLCLVSEGTHEKTLNLEKKRGGIFHFLDLGNEICPCWPDQNYCFALFSWFILILQCLVVCTVVARTLQAHLVPAQRLTPGPG